jgi:hypothetical protein
MAPVRGGKKNEAEIFLYQKTEIPGNFVSEF